MAHDEFNSGARHGFNMALYAVRNVDKQINCPERKDFTQEDWSFEYAVSYTHLRAHET